MTGAQRIDEEFITTRQDFEITPLPRIRRWNCISFPHQKTRISAGFVGLFHFRAAPSSAQCAKHRGIGQITRATAVKLSSKRHRMAKRVLHGPQIQGRIP
jgi:hypothetical protein